jgi:hypothetical protein
MVPSETNNVPILFHLNVGHCARVGWAMKGSGRAKFLAETCGFALGEGSERSLSTYALEQQLLHCHD